MKECHNCNDKTTRIVKIPMCQSCLVEFLNDYNDLVVNEDDKHAMNILHNEDNEACEEYIQKICKQVGIEIEDVEQ